MVNAALFVERSIFTQVSGKMPRDNGQIAAAMVRGDSRTLDLITRTKKERQDFRNAIKRTCARMERRRVTQVILLNRRVLHKKALSYLCESTPLSL